MTGERQSSCVNGHIAAGREVAVKENAASLRPDLRPRLGAAATVSVLSKVAKVHVGPGKRKIRVK